MPKLRYGPLTLNIKTFATTHKSVKRHNIYNLCLCLKLEQKCQKFYLPSTFQSSDIELLGKKLKRNIHLTKSP